MIEIKICDIDESSLSNLSTKLKDQSTLTYEYLPVTDKKGNILACDSQYGDIAIQVYGILKDLATEVAIALLVDWLKELIQNNGVGLFFTIGSTKISKNQLTEEQIREIIMNELEKKSKENSEE